MSAANRARARRLVKQYLDQNDPFGWFEMLYSSEHIIHLVAPGGKIIVISRGREPQENPGEMLWPLTQRELSFFKTQGLVEISFEDFLDQEDPPVRRFRGVYKRKTVNASSILSGSV